MLLILGIVVDDSVLPQRLHTLDVFPSLEVVAFVITVFEVCLRAGIEIEKDFLHEEQVYVIFPATPHLAAVVFFVYLWAQP